MSGNYAEFLARKQIRAEKPGRQWRNIPSFPNYRVSDDGQVAGSRGLLTRHIDACGYYRLGLYRDGKRINCRVHQLVALAFLGPRPDGSIIRHINGQHLDNRVENLCWGTQSENVRDSIAHGTQRNIRKTHCPRGHAYDALNTHIEKAGNRKCRACHRDAERSRRAARRANA